VASNSGFNLLDVSHQGLAAGPAALSEWSIFLSFWYGLLYFKSP